MGLRKYLIFGIILLIAMGLAIYTVIGGSYHLPLSGSWKSIELPIAVWAIIPALILFLLTLAHIMFYGSVGQYRMRKIRKDSDTLLQNLKNALLGKLVGSEYKTELFKLPGVIVPLLNIDPKRYADHRVFDDGIQDILDTKRKVEEGEVVELDQYSLKNDNALILKNHANKLNHDKSHALTVLKECKDKNLCQKAHLALASFGSINDIGKYKVEPTHEFFDTLVDRINSDENSLEISDDLMVTYIKELNFSSDDFVNLAKKLQKKINPDRVMLLFERFSHKFPNEAGEAYLYIMFELQMIDNARDFLENSAENEYAKYKYMLFLKDSGKNFDTELFI